MAKMIFVNLPVKDVEASIAFYQAIGATKDERFSQPGKAASMQFSDTIVFMLLSHDFFAGFSPKPIADAHQSTEVLLCLSQDSRGGGGCDHRSGGDGWRQGGHPAATGSRLHVRAQLRGSGRPYLRADVHGPRRRTRRDGQPDSGRMTCAGASDPI